MKPSPIVLGLFVLAFGLLAAVNGLVMSRVEANRSGEAEATVWLTERELPVINRLSVDNSGMDLRLNWRLPTDETMGDARRPLWLTTAKLHHLGFRVEDGLPTGERRQKMAQTREVFLVLESNGPAYLEAVRRAEAAVSRAEEALRANPADREAQAVRQQARRLLRAEEAIESRLFVIDAGTSAQALRTLYANRSRYIVIPGVIRLSIRGEQGRDWLVGAIESIANDTLHVPLEHRRAIDTLMQSNRPQQGDTREPRYAVQVAYGSRQDPWITAVRPVGEQGQ